MVVEVAPAREPGVPRCTREGRRGSSPENGAGQGSERADRTCWGGLRSERTRSFPRTGLDGRRHAPLGARVAGWAHGAPVNRTASPLEPSLLEIAPPSGGGGGPSARAALRLVPKGTVGVSWKLRLHGTSLGGGAGFGPLPHPARIPEGKSAGPSTPEMPGGERALPQGRRRAQPRRSAERAQRERRRHKRRKPPGRDREAPSWLRPAQLRGAALTCRPRPRRSCSGTRRRWRS